MKLVFAGTPQAAVPSLDALLASHHQVLAVITRPEAPTGRGRRVRPSPVAERAHQAGLELLEPRRAHAPEFLDRLREIAPDCCPVVAYGALLRPAALAIPPYGWINLHFSVLPAWRGAAPVQAAIRAGDDVAGASTFRIVPELDAGPVFGTLTEPIHPTDTSGDLLDRLSSSGARLLLETLDGIESGALVPREQPDEGVSYAPKVEVTHARVNWRTPAEAIDRHVRSCTPEPGAWAIFRGERLKLGPLTPDPAEPPLPAGAVRAQKHSVHVGTATTPVRLGQVQPKGKRPMAAEDWARGSRPEESETFD